jgi:hypothetical protein
LIDEAQRMGTSYDRTYQGIARKRLEAALPFGWDLIEFRAREVGGGGRVVATVEWSGDHEMTLDLAVTSGGVEAAMVDAIRSFERLAAQELSRP